MISYKKLVSLLLAIGLSLTGCSNAEHKLNRQDLAFLQKGMNMADVVAAIERPYRDVGSGLYILEYQLEDGGARLHFDANRKLDGWEFIPLRTTRNHSLGPVG